MTIVNLTDRPPVPVTMAGAAGACRSLVLGQADGVPSHSVRVFTLAPGGHTPWHAHAWEHTNYIISGHGELVDAAGQARPLRTGDFVLVQPNEIHQYRNADPGQPFVMICAVPKSYE